MQCCKQGESFESKPGFGKSPGAQEEPQPERPLDQLIRIRCHGQAAREGSHAANSGTEARLALVSTKTEKLVRGARRLESEVENRDGRGKLSGIDKGVSHDTVNRERRCENDRSSRAEKSTKLKLLIIEESRARLPVAITVQFAANQLSVQQSKQAKRITNR